MALGVPRDDRFEALLDAAPVMIWISGTDAKCTWFNEAWLAYRGRKMAEEQGDGWAQGVHPDDLDRCVRTYRDHFARQARFRMEYRLQRADGSYGWILDDGVPRYGDSGDFQGFIGSCVDITDQKDAQRVLRSQGLSKGVTRGLLHDLLRRIDIPASVLREAGRALARDRKVRPRLDDYLDVYRELGLGDIVVTEQGATRWVFEGTDLLERHAGATLPTCHLTLGFLEGAISATIGAPALGNEMRCQSAGHERCRFLVIRQG